MTINKRFFIAGLAACLSAAPLRADVTPKDVKDEGNAKVETIGKNTREAGKKATTPQDGSAAPKKKRSFLGSGELNKDRSLPKDKPAEKRSLNDELTRVRG